MGRGSGTFAQGLARRREVKPVVTGHAIGDGCRLGVIEGCRLEGRQHFIVAAIASIGCRIVRHRLAHGVGAIVAGEALTIEGRRRMVGLCVGGPDRGCVA